jgi:uncharacterized membrane protein
MNPNISRRRRQRAAQTRNESAENGAQRSVEVNVGQVERQVSMWGGTLLAVYGLLRRSISGLALAAIGGALIYRGHTGHCQVYEALGHSTAEEAGR